MRRRGFVHALLLCAALLGVDARAAAQAAAKEPQPADTASCDTPGDTHVSGETRCVASEPPSADPPLLLVPRLVLAPARLLLRTTSELLLAVTRVEDRYQVSQHALELFFNDDRTFGVYPVGGYETGIGLSAGAALVHHDLLGHRESVSLRAVFAGLHRQAYIAHFDTGQRWDDLRLLLLTGYGAFENLRFYGIGNADSVAADEVTPPLDAQDPGVAVHTVFREQQARATIGARVNIGGLWRVEVRDRFRYRFVSSGDPGDSVTPWVSEVFAPDSLTGIDQHRADTDADVALIWDGRRVMREDLPEQLPSRGTRFAANTGLQVDLKGETPPFAHVGLEVAPSIDLFRADRVLLVRLRGEAVLGSLDTIPFYDLPVLGGSTFLRGYDPERFRGRISLLSTVQYRYPVSESIASFIFVDAGRVYVDWSDITLSSLSDTRVGFGCGLQFYYPRGTVARLQLSSSIDGGLFLNLVFNTFE
jgi:hypothetical protein